IRSRPDRSQFVGSGKTGTVRRAAAVMPVEGPALRQRGGGDMETAAADRLVEADETPQLIGLTTPGVERGHPRPARPPALAAASFTGLTCLGLATAVIAPRFDRRLDPRADIAVASSPRTAGTAPKMEPVPVVATAVMASRSGPRQFVHVSGAALGP